MTIPYVGIRPKEYEVTINDDGRIYHMRVSKAWIREHLLYSIVPYVDGENFGMGKYVSYRPIREGVRG